MFFFSFIVPYLCSVVGRLAPIVSTHRTDREWLLPQWTNVLPIPRAPPPHAVATCQPYGIISFRSRGFCSFYGNVVSNQRFNSYRTHHCRMATTINNYVWYSRFFFFKPQQKKRRQVQWSDPRRGGPRVRSVGLRFGRKVQGELQQRHAQREGRVLLP